MKQAVTIVIADLGSGGAQKIAVSLAGFILSAGHNVTIITLAGPEGDFYTVPQQAQRMCLYETGKSGHFVLGLVANMRRIFKLRKAIRTAKGGAVLSFIGPTNILTILACLGLNARVVISERNDPARQSFGSFWDALRRLLYRYADIVTANSQQAIDAMHAYVPMEKLMLIPNQLQRPESVYLKPSSAKENIILAVGRLHPQKGFDILLKAFVEAHKQNPDWRLVILGKGPREGVLKDEARALGISNAVDFMGVVQNPYEFYARAPIYVLSSRHEGTPNALLEAMSCGLAPVVSDACHGALAYVQSQKSGLIFKSENVADLERCLLALMDDSKAQADYGLAAKHAVSGLDAGSIYKLWEKALDLKT